MRVRIQLAPALLRNPLQGVPAYGRESASRHTGIPFTKGLFDIDAHRLRLALADSKQLLAGLLRQGAHIL